MTQRTAIIAALVAPAFQKSGKCPFGYESKNSSAKSTNTLSQVADGDELSLQTLFTCPSTATVQTTGFTYDDYEGIVSSVVSLYEAQSSVIQSGSNPRATMAGCLIRLAGHDFMDYRIGADGTTSGGSDACINFADPDNMGLESCITQFELASAY